MSSDRLIVADCDYYFPDQDLRFRLHNRHQDTHAQVPQTAPCSRPYSERKKLIDSTTPRIAIVDMKNSKNREGNVAPLYMELDDAYTVRYGMCAGQLVSCYRQGYPHRSRRRLGSNDLGR